MAEVIRTGGHHHGAVSLLTTKLYVPPVRPGFIARHRLNELLDRGRLGRLVLVAAPAGFGKSALLAAWAAEKRDSVAWLSLDESDNDPARFWRYVVAALDRARLGLRATIEPLLTSESTPIEPVIDELINEITRETGPVTLVLDDYHTIRSPAVHDALQHFIDRAPHEVAVVLASRSDPPLNLARMRAAGELAEIGIGDLRFDADEVRAVLQRAIGHDVSQESAQSLAERTEGWAAGLQLASLSLRERSDPDVFVASFSGDNRLVADYLTAEVLSSQTEDIRDFLTRVSILDRISGELCDFVTGRSDSQYLLEAVERANLFLIPLDDERRWWRFHHLFAELLQTILRRETPDLELELHQRAAQWHERHGFADEAIEHALAAGDATRAAVIAERHADERLMLSEGATVRRWLAALPEDVIATRTRLLLVQANLALVSGDNEAFNSPLTAAQRAFDAESGPTDECFEPSAGSGASLLVNLPASLAVGRAHMAELSGDFETTRQQAREAREQLQDHEWMLEILVFAHLAIADFLAGDLVAAAAGFEANLARCRKADEKIVAGRNAELLGACYRGLGQLDRAAGAHSDADRYLSAADDRQLPICGRVLVARADVEYQRNDLEAARQDLAVGIPLCRAVAAAVSGSPQPLSNALTTLAWLRRAQGDRRGAHSAMAEAVECAPGPDVASILNQVPAQQARMMILDGDMDGAEHWAADSGPNPDEIRYADEPNQLVVARLLIAQGHVAQAEELLDRLEASAGARVGSLIEIRALQALARRAAADSDAAVDRAWDALGLAAPERWTRVFVDEGQPMHSVIRAATSAALRVQLEATPEPQAQRHSISVLRAFEAVPQTPNQLLVEPLSDRELEVLRMLAEGRANAEIANLLFVTQDTVKKHVTHILGKLGVSNRTQAAARARELDLVA